MIPKQDLLTRTRYPASRFIDSVDLSRRTDAPPPLDRAEASCTPNGSGEGFVSESVYNTIDATVNSSFNTFLKRNHLEPPPHATPNTHIAQGIPIVGEHEMTTPNFRFADGVFQSMCTRLSALPRLSRPSAPDPALATTESIVARVSSTLVPGVSKGIIIHAGETLSDLLCRLLESGPIERLVRDGCVAGAKAGRTEEFIVAGANGAKLNPGDWTIAVTGRARELVYADAPAAAVYSIREAVLANERVLLSIRPYVDCIFPKDMPFPLPSSSSQLVRVAREAARFERAVAFALPQLRAAAFVATHPRARPAHSIKTPLGLRAISVSGAEAFVADNTRKKLGLPATAPLSYVLVITPTYGSGRLGGARATSAAAVLPALTGDCPPTDTFFSDIHDRIIRQRLEMRRLASGIEVGSGGASAMLDADELRALSAPLYSEARDRGCECDPDPFPIADIVDFSLCGLLTGEDGRFCQAIAAIEDERQSSSLRAGPSGYCEEAEEQPQEQPAEAEPACDAPASLVPTPAMTPHPVPETEVVEDVETGEEYSTGNSGVAAKQALHYVHYDQFMTFDISVSDLPAETLLHIELLATPLRPPSAPPADLTAAAVVGWAAIPVFGEDGGLIAGQRAVQLLPDTPERHIGGIAATNTTAPAGFAPCALLDFYRYPEDIYFVEPPVEPSAVASSPEDSVAHMLARLVDDEPEHFAGGSDGRDSLAACAASHFPGALPTVCALERRVRALVQAAVHIPDHRTWLMKMNERDLTEDVVEGTAAASTMGAISGKLTERLRSNISTLRHGRSSAELREIKLIIRSADPLTSLSDVQRELIWRYRHLLAHRPEALVTVIAACPWASPVARAEMRALVSVWAPQPEPAFWMSLIVPATPDEQLRAVAVDALDAMDDADLRAFVLQCLQSTKNEVRVAGATARWLVQRALMSPYYLGHDFYWQTVSEGDNPVFRERVGILRAAFLRGFGTEMSSVQQYFLNQHVVVGCLAAAARCAQAAPKAERVAAAMEHLHPRIAGLPAQVTLPTSPYHEVGGVTLEDIKVMDSKKAPIRITFKALDPNSIDIQVLFKAGDDLRQDQLVLQLLRIMERRWRRAGLDLRMSVYGCTATAADEGMLEVVRPAETTAKITVLMGGGAIKGSFNDATIMTWLQQKNPQTEDEAVDNFARSLAGYCVATYVLGIGDRHNDNIMIKHNGCLFHIDFGWFLGRFKTKFGIKRERAPFVFTSDFARVLGGKKGRKYKEFTELMCRAYNVLRRDASFYIGTLMLCMSGGIWQLGSWLDVEWFRSRLDLEKTSVGAAEHFRELTRQSLECTMTRVNNTIHLLVH